MYRGNRGFLKVLFKSTFRIRLEKSNRIFEAFDDDRSCVKIFHQILIVLPQGKTSVSLAPLEEAALVIVTLCRTCP